ncbi:MAG: anhydro-N-acetylmuramic acid kinase [Planctomycetota bacterium]|nr:anhydro-N-acetylmuramic acid kinase [Planctomycetota bacterium]
MGQEQRLIAGAMSGTSADGVDIALTRIQGHGLEMSAKLLSWRHLPFPGGLREAIHRIRDGSPVPLAVLAGVGREISLCYAAAVNEALTAAGLSSRDLAAVAAHGQTLFHDPPDTIQWLDPALVAAIVGSAVVSDFRRADCAAGGQGAPLVPLADYLLFRDATKNRVLLNLGGIANLTYLPAGGGIARIIGFDTGPANCISDYLSRQFNPHGPGHDEAGARAATGVPVYPILQMVLSAPYFAKAPPKSTDGPAMVKLFTDVQAQLGRRYPLEYLLRTSCLIAADTIVQAMRQFLNPFPDEIIVSGGGTRNETLMSMIRQPLGETPVRTIDAMGIPSSAKEALAFALLGAATLDNVPGNVPSATGARRAVVLGSVTPKP